MRLRTAADVGAAIRHRRRELALDQATLAKRVGVSRQWVVEIERGKSRAALGLVLRTLEALDVVVRIGSAPPVAPPAGPATDLEAILRAHRGPKARGP